jgi:hypothetical protein
MGGFGYNQPMEIKLKPKNNGKCDVIGCSKPETVAMMGKTGKVSLVCHPHAVKLLEKMGFTFGFHENP